MTYLVDTNVISEARRSRPEPHVVGWLDETRSTDLHLSVLAIGEIRQGIEQIRARKDKRQAEVIERWLEELLSEFAERLIPISSTVSERWGRLNAARPLPVVDGLMAATALEHDLTFVTRDAASLIGTGVRLLDPWLG